MQEPSPFSSCHLGDKDPQWTQPESGQPPLNLGPTPDSNLPGQALLGWPLPTACRLRPGPGHPSPSHSLPSRQLILNSWGLGWRQLCAQGWAEGRTHMFSLQSSGAGRREKESRLNFQGDRQMGGVPVPAASITLAQGSEVGCPQWRQKRNIRPPWGRRRKKRAGVLEGCGFGVAGDTTAGGPGTRGL